MDKQWKECAPCYRSCWELVQSWLCWSMGHKIGCIQTNTKHTCDPSLFVCKHFWASDQHFPSSWKMASLITTTYTNDEQKRTAKTCQWWLAPGPWKYAKAEEPAKHVTGNMPGPVTRRRTRESMPTSSAWSCKTMNQNLGLETRSPKQGIQNQKSKARNPKLSVPPQESKTRNAKRWNHDTEFKTRNLKPAIQNNKSKSMNPKPRVRHFDVNTRKPHNNQ